MLSEDDLICPVTLELLTDPVQVPCCGKSVSRAALVVIGNSNRTCPMCREVFPPSFNAATAPPNRMLVDIVNSFIEKKKQQHQQRSSGGGAAAVASSSPTTNGWDAKIIPINNHNNIHYSKLIAQLQITCSKIPVEAQPSPTLCVLVNDQSGSMSGNPSRQVIAATKHILAMSHTNPMVETRVINYASTATVMRSAKGRRLEDLLQEVDLLRAGGGTNFSHAFQAIVNTLKEIKESAAVDLHTASIKDASIIFLTDGQATEGNRNDLPANFKKLLEPLKRYYDNVTVHAVGFSKDCDQDLLEALRKVGFSRDKNSSNTGSSFETAEGLFRYAQPGDDDDMLCSKLTSLYEVSAKAASLPIQVEFLMNNNNNNTNIKISFASANAKKLNVSADQSAAFSAWIEIEDEEIIKQIINKNNNNNNILNVKVISNDLFTENAQDPSITIPVHHDEASSSSLAQKQVTQLWLMKLVDGVAENILQLVNDNNNNNNITRQLTIALLEHRINFIHSQLESAENKNQCNVLKEQLLALKRGGAVVVGRLNDLRFASAFSQLVPAKNNTNNNNNQSKNTSSPPPAFNNNNQQQQKQQQQQQQPPLALTYQELVPFISQQSRNHSPFHKLIYGIFPRRSTKEAESAIASLSSASSLDQLLHDSCPEGNTILHLLAFGGHDGLIKQLFDVIKQNNNESSSDIIYNICTRPNKANETPITFAIKRRGFHSTLEVMLSECCNSKNNTASSTNPVIAENRLPTLKRFCIDHGFPRTAGIIASQWEQQIIAKNDNIKNNSNINGKPSSTNGARASNAPPSFVLTKIDKNISKDYALFLWNQIPEKEKAFSTASAEIIASWIEVGFEKHLDGSILDFFFSSSSPGFNIIRNMMNTTSSSSSLICFDTFCDHCFPPKADHPQVDFYLNRFRSVINVIPALKSSRDAKSGDSILHKAVDKGNLPFVEYILANTANNNNIFSADLLESRNDLGNTPLYLACAKRYPCIIDCLLNHGADPDAANLKGNVPLSAIAQMGPAKVAETLLAAGASVSALNKNGDSLLLLCCRNGQHEVLRLLLSQAPKKLIKHRAHIDGFDVFFASVEADKVDCLRVLLDLNTGAISGVKEILDARTADDNEIISGASLLHLAAYYNRSASAEFLLNFIAANASPSEALAFVNAKDKTGSTALHIAVLRNHTNMVALLRRPQWKANANIRDVAGVTAAAYAKEKSPEIYEMLVDALLQPALAFARGAITSNNNNADIESSCQAWKNLAGIPGFMSAAELSDSLRDETSGRTLLATAVVYSNLPAIKMFLEIGCDPLISQNADDDNNSNHAQLNSIFWAKWAKNARILNIFDESGIDVDHEKFASTCAECLKRLNDANRRSGLADKNVLFLGGGIHQSSLNQSSSTRNNTGSCLNERMNLFCEFVLPDTPSSSSTSSQQENTINKFLMIKNDDNNNVSASATTTTTQNWLLSTTSTSAKNSSRVPQNPQQQQTQQTQNFLDFISSVSIWEAKIRVCEIIASSPTTTLSPSELFALCLYSKEPICSRETVRNIGRFVMQSASTSATPDPSSLGFFSSLWKAIEKLPCENSSSSSEVYCGFEAGTINRQQFELGAEVAAFNIFSCTTSWPVAAGFCSCKSNNNKPADNNATASSVADFDSSNGTIFIIHPKNTSNTNNNNNTFRLVGTNTVAPSDCEGVFLPGSRFKVVRWMKGDVIALGQPNIREHTFALKTQEARDLYSGNKRPLIIELDEI